MRAEQLLRADDLRAALGSLLDFRDRFVEIEARLRRTTHLYEPNGDLVSVRCHHNCDSNRASPTLQNCNVGRMLLHFTDASRARQQTGQRGFDSNSADRRSEATVHYKRSTGRLELLRLGPL